MSLRGADGILGHPPVVVGAGPADDPYAPDAAVLHASRGRVLELADMIVPGHGAPFRPTDATPR